MQRPVRTGLRPRRLRLALAAALSMAQTGWALPALARPAPASKGHVLAAPEKVAPPPHVAPKDPAKARRVLAAVRAIAAAHHLPAMKRYEIPKLMCQLLTVPHEPKTYDCLFTVIGKRGAPTRVRQDDKALHGLAEHLYEALAGAGAHRLEDFHYYRITAAKLRVSAASLELDDTSHWTPPTTTNVHVQGKAARSLLDAFRRAGIRDDDHTLLVICRRFGGQPDCSQQRHQRPGPKLTPGESRSVWSALIGAARAAKYRPERGTLAGVTIVNARSFSFDGRTLAFRFVGDSVTLPPPVPRTSGHRP